MPPLPRATCPACGREVALRTRGELREHLIDSRTLDVWTSKPPMCWASGLTVAAATVRVRAKVDRLRGGEREHDRGAW